MKHRGRCRALEENNTPNEDNHYPLEGAASCANIEKQCEIGEIVTPARPVGTHPPLEGAHSYREEGDNSEMEELEECEGHCEENTPRCSVALPPEWFDCACKRKIEDSWNEITLKFKLSSCQIHSIEQRRDGFKECLVDMMNVAKHEEWRELESVARLLIAGECCVNPIHW
jgi:hypothetical protein